ncbi:MAG TPA: hypothetical protein VGM06_25380 [Polyangiaceae bacterium]|jgi:hypothetical protein
MPELRRLAADANHSIASFGPLLLSVWKRETTVEALQGMEQLIPGIAQEAPEGRVGLFVVVEPHASMPSSEARAELSRIRRTSAIGLTALVFEGDGFAAALVRGVTTSLNLLERGRTRTHIFANVSSAAAWIATAHVAYGGGAELEAATKALRASSGPSHASSRPEASAADPR